MASLRTVPTAGHPEHLVTHTLPIRRKPAGCNQHVCSIRSIPRQNIGLQCDTADCRSTRAALWNATAADFYLRRQIGNWGGGAHVPTERMYGGQCRVDAPTSIFDLVRWRPHRRFFGHHCWQCPLSGGPCRVAHATNGPSQRTTWRIRKSGRMGRMNRQFVIQFYVAMAMDPISHRCTRPQHVFGSDRG